MARAVHRAGAAECVFLAVAFAEALRYGRAAEANDLDTAVVFAGECVDLIRDVKPAATASLIHEAEAALRSNVCR